MLKLGILLDACGIKATTNQAQKLESFVNFWLKKHYVSKADIENQKLEKSDKDDTSADKENHPQTDAETQTDEEISAQVC